MHTNLKIVNQKDTRNIEKNATNNRDAEDGGFIRTKPQHRLATPTG